MCMLLHVLPVLIQCLHVCTYTELSSMLVLLIIFKILIFVVLVFHTVIFLPFLSQNILFLLSIHVSTIQSTTPNYSSYINSHFLPVVIQLMHNKEIHCFILRARVLSTPSSPTSTSDGSPHNVLHSSSNYRNVTCTFLWEKICVKNIDVIVECHTGLVQLATTLHYIKLWVLSQPEILRVHL